MGKRSLAIFTLVMFCIISMGCAIATSNFRSRNRQNISRLGVGMDKVEVARIMGDGSLNVGYFKTTNPHKTEVLSGKGKTFEVWYYYTDKKASDNVISDDELTPVLFENGVVIGWGQIIFHDMVRKYEIRVR